MDLFSISLLLLLIFFCTLVAVLSTKKSIGVKVKNLILAVLAFGATVLLLKFGVFDFLGKTIGGLIGISIGSKAVENTVVAFINYAIRVAVFSIVFWISYFILKLLALIVIKAAKLEKTAAFQAPTSTGGAIAVGIVSFITCWFCCFITFLPISATVAFAGNIAKTANNAENQGTYTYELAQSIDESFPFVKEDSVLRLAKKYTGANAVCELALNTISDISVETNNNYKVSSNFHKLLNDSLDAGVKGMKAYEEYLHSSGKYSDLFVVNDLLEYITTSDVFVGDAGELAGTQLFADTDNEHLINIRETINGKYTEGKSGVDNARKDILVLDDIVKDFLEEYKDVKFDSEELAITFVEYVSDRANAETFVSKMSGMTVYGEIFEELCKYGVQELCNILNIDYTLEEAYESFFNSLLENVNINTGYIDLQLVDAFIKKIAQDGTTIEDYREEYKDADKESQPVQWLENYDRYMDKFVAFADAFNGFKIDEENDNVIIRVIDNKIYTYEDETDKWVITASKDFKNISALNDYLIQYYNACYGKEEIKEDRLRSDLKKITAADLGEFSVLGNDYLNYNLSVIEKYAEKEKFTAGIVLGKEITDKISVKQNADIKKDNAAVAAILIVAGNFYETFASDNQGAILDIVLGHFGDIGRILDALNDFSTTEDTPELILRAISERNEFADYFRAENIELIIKNVESGTSTYAEFFNSIESLYNIAKEIID